jgi:hypothetical protein
MAKFTHKMSVGAIMVEFSDDLTFYHLDTVAAWLVHFFVKMVKF